MKTVFAPRRSPAPAAATLLATCFACSSPQPEPARIGIVAEPGGSCERACFDVQSTKDVSFIAVDADACSDDKVELSFYFVDKHGKRIQLTATPAPRADNVSCPEVSPAARTLAGLSGMRWAVCTSGAERVTVHVLSITTCESQAFDVVSSGPCKTPSEWLRETSPGSAPEPGEVAGADHSADGVALLTSSISGLAAPRAHGPAF